MWELHLVKLVKKGKSKIVIRDVYFNHDRSVGAISDKNYLLESTCIKEFQEKIDFIQTHVYGREIVIYEVDSNRIYPKQAG